LHWEWAVPLPCHLPSLDRHSHDRRRGDYASRRPVTDGLTPLLGVMRYWSQTGQAHALARSP